MAITTVETPQALTPAYNPMYFSFDSTNKTQLGFRYLIEVVNDDTSEILGTYKMKPIPNTLYGEVDVRKLIQSALSTEFDQTARFYRADGHQVNYKLNIDEEYFVNVAFSDYLFAGGSSWLNFSDPSINPNGFSRTMLQHTIDSGFVAGDVINIVQTSGVNFRPELEGIHTVLDVFLDTGIWYTVLDLPWIGSGAASGGTASYSDGFKSVFTGITTATFTAWKGAFSLLGFKDYNHDEYIADDFNKNLLTTLPSEVRISRNKPTWLSAYTNTSSDIYIVFDVSGTLYRYQIAAIQDVIHFDVIPSDLNIEDTYNGATWVAFGGGFDLSGVESYTVRIIQITGFDTPLSELVTINLYNECDFYTTYDVCFLDRYNSWITIPFNKGSNMVQEVARQSIRKKYGGLVESTWTYESTDTGNEVYDVEEIITYTVRTGHLSEIESQYMRELISSPRVFVSINGGEFQSIEIVTTSQPLHLQRMQKDRKVALTFRMAVQDEING